MGYLEVLKHLFRKKLEEDFPPGNVLGQENPDFVVECAKGRLGIEMREIVRSESVAAQAGFCDKLVRDAKRLCEKWGVPPLYVVVWITDLLNQVQGQVAQKQFAERLAKVLKDAYEGHRQDSASYFILDQPSDGLLSIAVTPLKEGVIKSLGGHLWDWKMAVLDSPLLVGQIQAPITEKNNKYERYRRSCDECWLVMVGDPYDYKMGSDISRNPEVIRHFYDTRFERVFYLQLYDVLAELQRRPLD
ncbi:MAG: hypothetical protein ISS79_07395 [Phycisphaerae bacterium]|nr:hypothetical protein [Phycisphaerae bacterium]